MWILPKQLHTSASVVDTAESDSDLNSFCQACERSLMWRSKPSLSATWLRRWKRGGFLKHLYTRMLRPSHTNDFVDAWTFYQGDFRVSRLAQQELERELKTLATSIPTSVEASESADQELFSSKTLKGLSVPKQQTENQFSNMSSATWKEWVTEQRQEYSQRKRLAHLIEENECSSWATPNVCGNHNRKGASKNSGDGLSTQVKSWATPNTMDTLPPRSPEKLAEAKKKGGCKNLREEVMNFPTPRTSDAEGGQIETFVEDGTFKSKRHKSNQTFGAKLRDAVESYPTPTASEDKFRLQGSSQQSKCLEALARTGRLDPASHSTNGKSQESWPTPRANKVHPEITEKNREHLANRNKSNLEENVAGHCGKATGKLNPSWVEQLMGLPVGWTDLGSWETESCQLPQPKHSQH